MRPNAHPHSSTGHQPPFPTALLTLCLLLLRTGSHCPCGLLGGQRRGSDPQRPQRPHAVLPPSPQGSSLPPSSLSLWKVHRSPESPSRCNLAPHSRGFSRHRRLPTLALPRRKGDEKAPGLNLGYKLCFLGFREPGGRSESQRRLPGRGEAGVCEGEPAHLELGRGLLGRSPTPSMRASAPRDLRSPRGAPALPSNLPPQGKSRPAPLRAAPLTFARFPRRRGAPSSDRPLPPRGAPPAQPSGHCASPAGLTARVLGAAARPLPPATAGVPRGWAPCPAPCWGPCPGWGLLRKGERLPREAAT